MVFGTRQSNQTAWNSLRTLVKLAEILVVQDRENQLLVLVEVLQTIEDKNVR